MEQGKFCEALSQPTAKLCLVDMGNCTQADFDFAKGMVCRTTVAPPTTTPPAPDLNTLVDKLLKTRPKSCQDAFAFCRSLPTPARDLMAEGKFCEALSDPSARLCLVHDGGCTEADFSFAKGMVCTAPPTSATTAAATTQAPTSPPTPAPTHPPTTNRQKQVMAELNFPTVFNIHNR